MEFRIKIKRYNNGDAEYYPQVKSGLLGKLGVWRYFAPLEYDRQRYTVWAKTYLFQYCSLRRFSEENAQKSINDFIETLIRPRRLIGVDYKYRVCKSNDDVKYI